MPGRFADHRREQVLFAADAVFVAVEAVDIDTDHADGHTDVRAIEVIGNVWNTWRVVGVAVRGRRGGGGRYWRWYGLWCWRDILLCPHYGNFGNGLLDGLVRQHGTVIFAADFACAVFARCLGGAGALQEVGVIFYGSRIAYRLNLTDGLFFKVGLRFDGFGSILKILLIVIKLFSVVAGACRYTYKAQDRESS